LIRAVLIGGGADGALPRLDAFLPKLLRFADLMPAIHVVRTGAPGPH
jgi:hypothetical protein